MITFGELKERISVNHDPVITSKDLGILKHQLDQLFSDANVEVNFTRHFLDRVNDARNKKQITVSELASVFAKAYKKFGNVFKKYHGDFEAVLEDPITHINIPFALHWNRNKHEIEIVTKTVMRKKGFKTPPRERVLKL